MLDPEPDAVNLLRTGDLWVVRVVERGKVHERTFVLEQFALSYATGQAHRLKTSVSRIEDPPEGE